MAIMFNFMRDRTKWVHFGAITSITATHLNNSWEVCVTIEGCHDAIPYCQYVFLMRFVLNSGSYIFSRKVTKVQVWSVKCEERMVPPPQCAARGVHCPSTMWCPRCPHCPSTMWRGVHPVTWSSVVIPSLLYLDSASPPTTGHARSSSWFWLYLAFWALQCGKPTFACSPKEMIVPWQVSHWTVITTPTRTNRRQRARYLQKASLSLQCYNLGERPFEIRFHLLKAILRVLSFYRFSAREKWPKCDEYHKDIAVVTHTKWPQPKCCTRKCLQTII